MFCAVGRGDHVLCQLDKVGDFTCEEGWILRVTRVIEGGFSDDAGEVIKLRVFSFEGSDLVSVMEGDERGTFDPLRRVRLGNRAMMREFTNSTGRWSSLVRRGKGNTMIGECFGSDAEGG